MSEAKPRVHGGRVVLQRWRRPPERSRIRAVLGPAISQDNYEVGPEFIERFLEDDPGLATHFTPSDRDGHWYFDLPGFIAGELWGSGIGLVEVIDRCSYQDEASFYSYRRATHREEDSYGRNLSAIALKPAPDA